MGISIAFRRAFSDLRQHFATQIMTTMVVTLSILILAFFALLYFNLQHLVERFGSELGLVVFMDENTPEERIPELYQKLAGLAGVEKARYISSEEAFARLQTYLHDEKEVLEGVSPRLLPPSFEIQINRAVFQLDRIRELADRLIKWPEVSKVQYGQEWIDRFEVFSRLLRDVVAVSGILLLCTSAFVVANTIKLTVYARQEELKIMRLVGATNTFIQGPFLIQAVIQGLIGSCLAIAVVFVCFEYMKDLVAVSELLRGVEVFFLPWPFVSSVIGSSVVLCFSGTALAMRRFLRL